MRTKKVKPTVRMRCDTGAGTKSVPRLSRVPAHVHRSMRSLPVSILSINSAYKTGADTLTG